MDRQRRRHARDEHVNIPGQFLGHHPDDRVLNAWHVLDRSARQIDDNRHA